MSKALTNEPSIEELLTSIRHAIHDGAEPPEKPGAGRAQNGAGRSAVKNGSNGNGGGRVAGSMRETRIKVSPRTPSVAASATMQSNDFLDLKSRLVALSQSGGAGAPSQSRGRSGAAGAGVPKNDGFAGIMGGDVRLEEALSRLRLNDEPAPADDANEFKGRSFSGPNADDDVSYDTAFDDTGEDQLEFEDDGLEFRPGIADDDHVMAPAERADFGEHLLNGRDRPEPVHRQATPAPAGHRPQALQSAGRSEAPARAEIVAAAGPDESVTGPEPVRSSPPANVAGTPLISDVPGEAVAAAFSQLADTIMQKASHGQRSMDDVTRDLLRPMLKSWLDKNLPELVEKLVRAEIARVARGPQR